MATSKTTGLISGGQLSPQHSSKKNQISYSGPDQVKIHNDIVTKRISFNKKDYFVFSMSDSATQTKNENPVTLKFNLYKDLLWKINYSNGLYVKLPDEI